MNMRPSKSFFSPEPSSLTSSLPSPSISAYALKHPSRVDKLILVSPAGIPLSDEPANLQIPIVESVTSSGEPRPLSATLPSDVPPTPPASPIERVPERIPSPGPKLGARLFNWGWELGVSPFGLIRSFPILAPKIVGFYTSRRFVGQAEEDVRDANAYLYATMMLKGSGEYCIHSILKVGAVARQGMEGRMDGIKVSVRRVCDVQSQPMPDELTPALCSSHDYQSCPLHLRREGLDGRLSTSRLCPPSRSC